MIKCYIERYSRSVFDWWGRNKIHILIWTIFVFQEVVLVGLFKQSFGSFMNYFVHYCINIGIFYFHARWLLPRVFTHRKCLAGRLVLFSLIELLTFTATVYVVDLFLILNTEIMQTNVISSHRVLIFGIVWRCLYFMMFSTGYYYFRAYFLERKEREDLERKRLLNAIQQEKITKELMIAKNAYLKAQVNPHFLFNTLDYIYHDVVKHSPKSGEAVLGLVEIMRFALDVENYGEYITVEEELAQLENLIALHRLTRKTDTLITLNYNDDVRHLKIIPLIILTLAENMLKHGDLKTVTGRVTIFKENGFLHITSLNLASFGKRNLGFGSGLSNVKGRLTDTYNGSARVEYSMVDNWFKVFVSIPANE